MREGLGGQEEGRDVQRRGKGRRNFPPHLTLAQAALGFHKGGLLSSQLCWYPEGYTGLPWPWSP